MKVLSRAKRNVLWCADLVVGLLAVLLGVVAVAGALALVLVYFAAPAVLAWYLYGLAGWRADDEWPALAALSVYLYGRAWGVRPAFMRMSGRRST